MSPTAAHPAPTQFLDDAVVRDGLADECVGARHVYVLYRMDRNGDETVLYTFDFTTVSGFGQPDLGVVRDAGGNLYGATFIGQADYGYGFGVVYKVDTTGRATVLHNFTNGADGGYPNNVILDSQGNLYGTAGSGGTSGNGVVFKIDPSGNETVLYNFTGGADGASPNGPLLRDSVGDLYGTTGVGGASGAGVVFKLDASGTETALYSFTGGADGGYPLWVLLARDSAGNLYGTTAGGGTAGDGVVFKVDTSGNEMVLHSFTGGAADGNAPYAGVVLGPNGNLYGTTPFGGQTNAGIVYEIQQ